MSRRRTVNISVRNLASAVCFVGAIVLISQGNQHGWGWLIFVGLIIHE